MNSNPKSKQEESQPHQHSEDIEDTISKLINKMLESTSLENIYMEVTSKPIGKTVSLEKENKVLKDELERVKNKRIHDFIVSIQTEEGLSEVVRLLIDQNRKLQSQKQSVELQYKPITEEWKITQKLPPQILPEKKWYKKNYTGSNEERVRTYLDEHWKGYPIHQSFFSNNKNGRGLYKFLADNELLWVIPSSQQNKFENKSKLIQQFQFIVSCLPQTVVDTICSLRSSEKTTLINKNRTK